ncbi:hypothetical protein DVK85_09155 [Flavobacterium arcticum]|uniref:Uncharacterized protein n=1 Tax=Flavobacterium arcticum TaxID=1784713 RepID=A0A345HCT0_9FLAO|nr:hypothetical protein [Flavobacterium arcticum]AXG74390.1 hypothetical protein DVK85_09155 [Flavobacterium arcticum]KAF2507494.1 hypothetical protein E0W72_11490 [Flavobacterium arcticum]
MDILRILSYIGYSILCINIIIYFIGFAKNNKAYKIFVYYLVAIAIIQGVMEFYAHKGYNNHFLSNYYLLSRFVLLSLFFYYAFSTIQNKISQFVKFTSITIIIGLVVQYSLYPEQYYQFNSLGFLITAAVLVLYAVFYLYEMLSKKLPFYYTIMGIFLYMLSSAVIFASATSIVSFNDKINIYIWKLNAFLFIVYQLLILWEWRRTFYPKLMKQEQ